MRREPWWAKEARALYRKNQSIHATTKLLVEKKVLRSSYGSHSHGPNAADFVWKALHPEIKHEWPYIDLDPPEERAA